MQSIADKMKDDIKYIGSIKAKLIHNEIWSDQMLSDHLSKTNNIESIEVSNDRNRLFISTKGQNDIKLEDSCQQLLDTHRNTIRNLLDSKELEVLDSLGTKKIIHIMCHTSNIPLNNTIMLTI